MRDVPAPSDGRSDAPSLHRAGRSAPQFPIPPRGVPLIAATGEIAPGQVWAGLSPALQAKMRQRALQILREVADDGR